MSIQSEIERLQTAKENLKTALTAKGVAIDDSAKLDQYGTFVEAIQQGVIVTDTTATPDDVLATKTFYTSDGVLSSGTIQQGEVWYLGDNQFSVTSGYYPETSKVTIHSGSVGVLWNTVEINAGYHHSSSFNVGSSLAPIDPYMPTTTDQIIAADTYLATNAVIKGEPNYLAENIKENVSMWGLVGTYSGTSGGVDVSGVTAQPYQVLNTAKYVNSNGDLVSGTMQTVSMTVNGNTVGIMSPGYIESGVVQIPYGQYSVVGNTVRITSAGYFNRTTIEVAGISFITAGADQILSGYIGADKDGNPVQGTIVTRTENDVTAIGTVVVAAGYYPSTIIKNLTASTATVSGNVVTITTGWKNFEQVTVGTALPGGMNITPSSTADYVLHQNSFITNGDITLAKEPNYLAENIKDGVSMWGLVGTYKGEGGGSDDGGTQIITVKVTEYSPYVPAYPAQVGYNVTAITDQNSEDFSAYLGLYTVTEETKDCTKFGRIFKSDNGKFLKAKNVMDGTAATDDSDPAYIEWRFGSSIDDYGSITGTPGSSGLPDSVTSWRNLNNYVEVTLNMTAVETSGATSEIPMVLKAAEVDSYDSETLSWTIKGEAKDYTEYDYEPVKGGIYTAYGSKLIGQSISVDRELEAFADIYAPLQEKEDTDVYGNTITYLNTNTDAQTYVFGEYQGVQCMRGGYIDFDCDHSMKKPMAVAFWHLSTVINVETYIFNFGYRTGNTNYQIGIRGINNKGQIIAITYNESTRTYYGSIEPNQWNHIAITYSPEGIVNWYINGELVGTTFNTNLSNCQNFINIGFHDYALTMGSRAPNTIYYNADFRVFWNKKLEAVDIKKLYLMGPNPSENEDTDSGGSTVIGTKLRVVVEETALPYIAGTYVLKDSTATGYDRIWEREDNSQYTIKWEGRFWSFYDGDMTSTSIGDYENPWDAQPGNFRISVIE